MSVRVILVDDEAPARKELQRLVGTIPGAEVVAVVAAALDVIPTLEATPCDLLFLDIEMPGKSGLEVASEVLALDDPPHIAFVTAYDQYAVEAFEREALDYVLKPADAARLTRVVERVQARTATPVVPEQLARASPEAAPLLQGSRTASDRRVLLAPARILFVEAAQDLVFLVTATDRLLSNRTLTQLETSLAPHGFVRTHRSYLVNLDAVREVEPQGAGTFVLYLEPKPLQVPVSRRHWARLKPQLGG